MQRRVPSEVHAARRARRGLSVACVAAAVTVLTACTGQSTSSSGFDRWYDRMQTVFADPAGVGGGGGATPGSVELSTMQAGDYVVYATCTDTDVVHLRIRGGSTVLAETDVPCGATVALAVTVSTAAARRFEITTSHPKGTTGVGWWSAQVNSTAWKQAASFGFG